MPTEGELIAQRQGKRERLLTLGGGYPARTRRTHDCAAAVAAFEATEAPSESEQRLEGEGGPPEPAPARELRAVVCGRVTGQRVLGKAAFLDARDGSGRLQLHLRRDVLQEEQYALLELLDLGDFVEAEGTLFRTRTGEVTLAVESWRILVKALRPLPEKRAGLTDPETRYRQRHLDLVANERSREVARLAAATVTAVRRFFEGRAFLEVATPVLQEQAGGAAARPFRTHHNALDRDLFLRISLELHLKRLLVGGFDRVFEIGRVFRNEGVSHRHNPEFLLVESYEAYADYEDVARMVEELVRGVAQEVRGTQHLAHGDHIVDLESPWARTTYREALREHAGIDYRDHPDRDSLARLAADRGVPVEAGASWATVLDGLMQRLVEPKLVQPTFVFDYPTALSPLAKAREDDPELVERFELFILGYEFANAYSELNDPVEQRERMTQQARKRAAGDEEAEIADEAFLEALEAGMPPAGGLGMGLERLMMLMTGEHSIREVVLFPALRDRDARASTAPEAPEGEIASDRPSSLDVP